MDARTPPTSAPSPPVQTDPEHEHGGGIGPDPEKDDIAEGRVPGKAGDDVEGRRDDRVHENRGYDADPVSFQEKGKDDQPQNGNQTDNQKNLFLTFHRIFSLIVTVAQVQVFLIYGILGTQGI